MVYGHFDKFLTNSFRDLHSFTSDFTKILLNYLNYLEIYGYHF